MLPSAEPHFLRLRGINYYIICAESYLGSCAEAPWGDIPGILAHTVSQQASWLSGGFVSNTTAKNNKTAATSSPSWLGIPLWDTDSTRIRRLVRKICLFSHFQLPFLMLLCFDTISRVKLPSGFMYIFTELRMMLLIFQGNHWRVLVRIINKNQVWATEPVEETV